MDGVAVLREAIRSAADEAGGYRALARRSRGLVSHSTLNNIANGRHSGRMREDQLAGVAIVTGRTPADVARLLGRPYADPADPFVLPERASRLTRHQRRVVLSVVDTILNATEAATDQREHVEVQPARALRAVARGSTRGREEAAEKARRVRQGEEPQR